MKTKHTQVGAGLFTSSVWIHKDMLDIEQVAHIGSIQVKNQGIGAQVEFNLSAEGAQALIDSLQQHINYIQEAQASLATSLKQEAA